MPEPDGAGQRRRLSRPVLAGAWAVVLAGALAAAFLHATQPENIFDEGFVVVSAWRMLLGEAPYRDFWTSYGPGGPAAVALAFELFGRSLLVSRALSAGFLVACVAAIFALCRKAGATALGVVAALAAALVLAAGLMASHPMLPALALAALALSLLSAEQASPWRWLGIGALVGLAALFRQDVGAYLGLSLVAGLLVAFGLRAWRPVGLIGAGTALVALAGYGPPVLLAGWHAAFEQLVVFPALFVPRYRHLPLPPMLPSWDGPGSIYRLRLWALAWLAPLAGIAAFAALTWLRRRPACRVQLARAAACVAFATLLCLQTRNRFEITHQVPELVFAVVALCACAILPRLAWMRAALAGAAILAALVAVTTVRVDLPAFPLAACLRAPGPVACGMVAPGRWEAARRIGAMIPPGARVFVALPRHDRIFVNDIMLYFLIGRRPATRWHEMNPGVVTTAAVQRAMIAELAREDVPFVVVAAVPDAPVEENGSALSSGVHLLDEWLAAHYVAAGDVGPYAILKRR